MRLKKIILIEGWLDDDINDKCMRQEEGKKEKNEKYFKSKQASKWSIVMLCSTYLQSVFIIADRLKIKFIINTVTIVKRQRKKISCRRIKYLFMACCMYLSFCLSGIDLIIHQVLIHYLNELREGMQNIQTYTTTFNFASIFILNWSWKFLYRQTRSPWEQINKANMYN